MDISQFTMMSTFFCLVASSFCLGFLAGIWIQQRKSQSETELLVGMWERMHVLAKDVENIYQTSDNLEGSLDNARRKSIRMEIELKSLQRDVDALYNIENEEDITLEMPSLQND